MLKVVYSWFLVYGDVVVVVVLEWVKKDMYNEIRIYLKFFIFDELVRWQFILLDYMDGIELYWWEIWFFVIDFVQ